MASLAMTGGRLKLMNAAHGEERLRTDWLSSCDSCPVMQVDGRRACIYDKVQLDTSPLSSRLVDLRRVQHLTARRGSEGTFLAGLAAAGLKASRACAGPGSQAASEGFVRTRLCLAVAGQLRRLGDPDPSHGQYSDRPRAAHRACAREELHQAPMTAMPGAVECLRTLWTAGFAIAVCSNWGWRIPQDDLQVPGGGRLMFSFRRRGRGSWQAASAGLPVDPGPGRLRGRTRRLRRGRPEHRTSWGRASVFFFFFFFFFYNI